LGSDTAVAVALTGAVGKNFALKSLDLRYNLLDGDAAQLLAEGLRRNRALTRLDLRDNRLGDAGAAALATAFGGGTGG
jgi:Ran GTPase-activating protein (RanGAP) involved in mRNA processing and transport